MKSAQDVLEDVKFLVDYIKENNPKGFEREFYDLTVTSIEMGDKRYDETLKESTIPKSNSYLGKIKFKLDYPVTEKFLNGMGGVHGAAIACWVDIVTSLAIYGFDA